MVKSLTLLLRYRVKHGPKSPLTPQTSNPPTPSTATTTVHTPTVRTPRPSPPGFYPAPAYCSSSASCLPSFQPIGPGVGLSSFSSHPHSSFKFDASSSRSNSENQDSDISESNSPRYTYTLPRSGEGTPRIGRAYDQVDLPFEYTSPIDNGRGHENMLVRTHHVSYDPIRFGDSRGRPVSANTHHKVASYEDIDSPQLRTQVTWTYIIISYYMRLAIITR